MTAIVQRGRGRGRPTAAAGTVPFQSILPFIFMAVFVFSQVVVYTTWFAPGGSGVDTSEDARVEATNADAVAFSNQILMSEESASSNAISTSKQEPSKIKRISVIGERNSGTRWTVSHLSNCFNHTLIVQEKLVRHKHWFQHDVDMDPQGKGKERVDTLVVSQFRDPYQWILAMKLRPHHSPVHCCKQDWKKFVTTEWNIERPASDLAIKEGNATLGIPTSQIQCQEHFTYDQINSCQLRPYNLEEEFPNGQKPPMSGHQPQYELRNDGSGLPYNNILELRADKIKNHLSVAEWPWVHDFIALQYEELLSRGTSFLVQHIEKATGVKAQCAPYEPQPKRTKYSIPRAYKRWLTDHLDWESEALVGYEPMK